MKTEAKIVIFMASLAVVNLGAALMAAGEPSAMKPAYGQEVLNHVPGPIEGAVLADDAIKPRRAIRSEKSGGTDGGATLETLPAMGLEADRAAILRELLDDLKAGKFNFDGQADALLRRQAGANTSMKRRPVAESV